MYEDIADNVRRVRDRLAEAAARAGRDPSEIELVAASKTRTAEEIRAAVAAGVTVIGESRVQEAEPKIAALAGLPCQWHLVGHLQRNKAARAVARFDCIQAVDSERLAVELAAQAARAQKVIRVLVEVNTSGEESKFGVEPAAAGDLAAFAAARAELELAGLMTVGPFSADRERVAGAFRTLRGIFEELKPTLPPAFRELSMGMTDDFEVAVAEGSTMVRIGRAIFGPR